MATFDNLCETFPDENCVLTNKELLGEVRKNNTPTTYIYFTVDSVHLYTQRS